MLYNGSLVMFKNHCFVDLGVCSMERWVRRLKYLDGWFNLFLDSYNCISVRKLVLCNMT